MILRHVVLLSIPFTAISMPAFSQQCAQIGPNATLPQVRTAVRCLLGKSAPLAPVEAQWPTAQEAGRTPINTAKGNSKGQSKTFTLPFTPSLAIVSVISIRDQGDRGSKDVTPPAVATVPQGGSVTVAVCGNTKLSLSGKTLGLDTESCSDKGGYPAMNIRFVP